MKIFKTISKYIYWLILVALILIAGFTALSALNIKGGFKLLEVLSGSMEPKIHTGSIVFVKPADSYQKGDIITFTDGKASSSVTHRVYDIKNKDGKEIFITKGDANNGPDSTETLKSQIIGKTYFSIPYVGYIINYTKTQQGLIILIIIPTVIIVYSELISIKNEAIRLIQVKKRRKLNPIETVEEKIGEEIIEIEKDFKKLKSKK